MNQTMPLQDSPRVRVHHEHFMTPSVQENRVGRLRAYPMNREELFAKLRRWRGEEVIQRPLMRAPEKSCKFLKFPGLLPEIAGGTDQSGEPRGGNLLDRGCREKSLSSKFGKRAFHIGPTGILREDGADNHLKPRRPGPPMLRAVRLEQRVIINNELWNRLRSSTQDKRLPRQH